ncbi:MAG: polysaccharide deacetylase family protein [Bacteroidales bacterium]|jgi:peptidoglycan/xylan/chitin deacetylase (PgdA/CDA1 family)|nr:polysaccharide deacetylase family protein [Bacteroidales bacterium]
MIRNYGRPFPAAVIYPDAIYRTGGSGRRLCLTFDDGPDSESTPRVLDILEGHGVRATFFCTGRKVQALPGLFARIASSGHATGNHGFSHLNGLKTPVREYCSDVLKGRDVTCSNLFRPPYGRIRIRQYRILERSMRIVFWDLMPYDFDSTLSPDASLRILMQRLRPGSLIVLHDTATSSALLYLDRFITEALRQGYTFSLPDDYSPAV